MEGEKKREGHSPCLEALSLLPKSSKAVSQNSFLCCDEADHPPARLSVQPTCWRPICCLFRAVLSLTRDYYYFFFLLFMEDIIFQTADSGKIEKRQCCNALSTTVDRYLVPTCSIGMRSLFRARRTAFMLATILVASTSAEYDEKQLGVYKWDEPLVAFFFFFHLVCFGFLQRIDD